MKGYKAFNYDWTCRGFQYEVGKTYETDEEIEICKSGFHFCQKLKDCFIFYPLSEMTKIAEIEALGDIDSEFDYTKSCTNKIKIVKEISFDEILKAFDIEKETWDRYITIFYSLSSCITGYNFIMEMNNTVDTKFIAHFHNTTAIYCKNIYVYPEHDKVIIEFGYNDNFVRANIVNNKLIFPEHKRLNEDFPPYYKRFIFDLINFLKNKFDLS